MVDTILTAAARVLTRTGYDDTTTNRIAEAAGVSVGSLYQYFPNKEAIVGALIERHDAEMWGVFADHVARSVDLPLAARVPSVIEAVFAMHVIDPALHRVLHQQVPRVGKLARMQETNHKARELVERILIAAGDQIDVTDTSVAAFVIVESVEALIHQALDASVDPAAVRREAATLVLRYLGVSPPT